MNIAATNARQHIYEFDLIRTITALTVVGVHVMAFTAWVYASPMETTTHYAVLDSIHWTRNIFLFITAFVLTYVYYGRPFSLGRFWIKRGIGVLVPYIVWSVAYSWHNNPGQDPATFAHTAVLDIVTGNASYQLYYIMLTLQMYIALPVFFAIMKRIARHPWVALTISFAAEMVFSYWSYQYLQQGPLNSTSTGQFLMAFQDRFLLTYQFYILLGGLGALYMNQARGFLLSHGKMVIGTFVVGLAIALGTYIYQVEVYRASLDLASFVIQPAMTLYSVGVIVFLCWLAAVWVSRSREGGRPPAYRFWHLLSDASFGIYLVQAFVLDVILLQVLPQMPAYLPGGLRVFLSWALSALSSALITIVLLQIPVASRLVGRPARWHVSRSSIAAEQGLANRLPRDKVQVER